MTLLLAVALAGPLPAQPSNESAAVTDDEFIDSLGQTNAQGGVDRRRLAKVLFGLAATLDSDKSTVRLVQSRAAPQESSARAVRKLLDAHYDEYLRTLDRFRNGVSKLIDQPESLLLLYDAVTQGQRTCWQLDLHNLVVDTYSSGSNSVLVLSSVEACRRLRTVAFQPRVEAIIRGALVERIFQHEKIRTLERDLGDLEDLLTDLREIEGVE